MSKSILIIDTPKSCADCRLKRGLFCGENGNSLYDYIHYDDSINDKPSWCQLKPLPTKKLATFDPNHCDIDEEIKIIHEIEGYNRCIDEILEVR